MSIDDKYQGFSNRETWLVAIWIANELDAYEYWQKRICQQFTKANRDGIATLAPELEEWCKDRLSELPTGMNADLTTASFERVDWVEIIESHWKDCALDHYDPNHDSFSSRDDAFNSGLLIDVTEEAEEAGFTIPVAFTGRAWAESIRVSEEIECQGQMERLRQVLMVLGLQNERSHKTGCQKELLFTVSVRTDEVTSQDIELKSICGTGDGGEPVLTIMMPVEG